MIFAVLHGFISFVLDVLATVGVAADEKDLEIALLRQQLRILERKGKGKHRLGLPEKLMLVTLAGKLKTKGDALHERVRIWLVLVQPETLLKWHRGLVRRKWRSMAIGPIFNAFAAIKAIWNATGHRILRLRRKLSLWRLLLNCNSK